MKTPYASEPTGAVRHQLLWYRSGPVPTLRKVAQLPGAACHAGHGHQRVKAPRSDCPSRSAFLFSRGLVLAPRYGRVSRSDCQRPANEAHHALKHISPSWELSLKLSPSPVPGFFVCARSEGARGCQRPPKQSMKVSRAQSGVPMRRWEPIGRRPPGSGWRNGGVGFDDGGQGVGARALPFVMCD
jgi:hypothetical protein